MTRRQLNEITLWRCFNTIQYKDIKMKLRTVLYYNCCNTRNVMSNMCKNRNITREIWQLPPDFYSLQLSIIRMCLLFNTGCAYVLTIHHRMCVRAYYLTPDVRMCLLFNTGTTNRLSLRTLCRIFEADSFPSPFPCFKDSCFLWQPTLYSRMVQA